MITATSHRACLVEMIHTQASDKGQHHYFVDISMGTRVAERMSSDKTIALHVIQYNYYFIIVVYITHTLFVLRK